MYTQHIFPVATWWGQQAVGHLFWAKMGEQLLVLYETAHVCDVD